ncbi:MAG: hypothetical protein EBZ78_04240, partial [Verrucomicrobia bacterium]|nr:hypothetical protein [Verrucomicrobiota bacterium]
MGINKAVTLTGLSLVGTGKDNYTVSAPSNLTGTILKGWVEIGISNTNQVYGKTNRVVATALNLNVPGLGVRTNYWGTNGTVYGPSSNGPVNAGSYGVEVVVEDNSQTYEGTNRAVLTIGKKSAVITAGSDTIRAGTVFSGTRYTGSGFLDGDTITGTLVTHLRSVSNTNVLVGYSTTNNQ